MQRNGYDGLALVSESTTQLFDQGIVATFLFVQVRTNWIRESAIKLKDVYYYYATQWMYQVAERALSAIIDTR
jgi:hypothetical protein